MTPEGVDGLGVAAGLTEFRCEMTTYIYAETREEAWNLFVERIGGKTHADYVEVEPAKS